MSEDEFKKIKLKKFLAAMPRWDSEIRKRKLLAVVNAIKLKLLDRGQVTNGFVQISRKSFDDLIGAAYVSEVIKILLNLKIIHRNKIYKIGAHSIPYRVLKPYWGSPDWKFINSLEFKAKFEKFIRSQHIEINEPLL